MNKITPDHLTRSAYVYVRQSTPDQLANNPESRRRQYPASGAASRKNCTRRRNELIAKGAVNTGE